MPQNKRRGTIRRKGGGDDSESESGEERSAVEPNEPSLSPEVPSQPLTHRSSNVDKHNHDGFAAPQMGSTSERREEPLQPIASSSRSKPIHAGGEPRTFFPDNELPHIATLSLPEHSPSTPVPMSAPSLPSIRPASEQQAAQRKRAATVPGKTTRQPASSGPKVVACNFCRGALVLFLCRTVTMGAERLLARKTKCDGAHPACASCARRSLSCNYVHDASTSNGPAQKKGRRGSSSKLPVDSPSPPSTRLIPTPLTANDGYDHREIDIHIEGEGDLKRTLEHSDISRPPKKMRMESSPAIAGIP